jgi:hypothetical protein
LSRLADICHINMKITCSMKSQQTKFHSVHIMPPFALRFAILRVLECALYPITGPHESGHAQWRCACAISGKLQTHVHTSALCYRLTLQMRSRRRSACGLD